jgi:hypothetical protein
MLSRTSTSIPLAFSAMALIAASGMGLGACFNFTAICGFSARRTPVFINGSLIDVMTTVTCVIQHVEQKLAANVEFRGSLVVNH